MIKIHSYIVGPIATNCYLIEDAETGKLAVIDPGDRCPELVDEIDRRSGELSLILLTHGHFDHVMGVAALCDRYHPEVCVCGEEMELLQNGLYNRSSVHHIRIHSFTVDRMLRDGDTIALGNSLIRFIHTPGHTRGSGCYVVDDCIFSGDTIFCESVGRTDFPTSSPADMKRSVRRIRDLEGNYAIYPGHDVFSTLEHERRYNPFMTAE